MENNENIEVDITAYEDARYQHILDTGSYAEVKILIGTETEKLNGEEGVVPCVRLSLRNVNAETVGFLYLTLQDTLDKLIKKYPLECFLGTLHDTTELGSFQKNDKNKKE